MYAVFIAAMPAAYSQVRSMKKSNPGGDAFFDLQDITPAGIHHCVLVAKDGSVLAFFGRQVRRSTDGGDTWGPPVDIGAGVSKSKVMDEGTGDIIAFSTEKWFRSTDNGQTWKPDGDMGDIPNRLETLEVNGVPVFSDWPVGSEIKYLNSPQGENGITLMFGKHKGRLVVPVRYQRRLKEGKFPYPGKMDLNHVIYSDDGGKSWKQGDPTLPFGKDESAIAEISDGSIIHISRNNIHQGNKHISWSYDGGETWEDRSISPVLPDGPRSGRLVRDGHFGLMAGLIRLPFRDHDILVFSNVDSEEGRKGMTVWTSFDGGRTWPVKRLVDEGLSDYSGLAAGREGTPSEGMIYLMYARGRGKKPALTPRIARFNLPWLIGGELTGDGELPRWVTRK